MDNIVFTLEFDDDSASESSNRYLEKGWKLLHVGTKFVDTYNGQACYNTTYVVGANREQYEQHKADSENNSL